MESIRTDASAQALWSEQPFRSALEKPADRFLAYIVGHGLKHGRRTASDFIRHFSPATIMEGLEDEPQLRANILVIATGVRMKVALKKSAASCGNDLQIALDERETDPETVVGLFSPDDQVRFLDSRALWHFLTEDEFWQVDAKKDPSAHAVAAAHIAYLIERALEDQLLAHRDVVRAITVQSMTKLLPRSELPKIIDAALELGHAKKPFLEKDLLDAIGIATITKHIPLATIWTQVIVPYIAQAHGLASAWEETSPAEKAHASEPRLKSVEAPPPPSPLAGLFNPARSAAVPAVPTSATAPVDESELDLAVDELLGSLGNNGQAAAKSSHRRPGSVPPSA